MSTPVLPPPPLANERRRAGPPRPPPAAIVNSSQLGFALAAHPHAHRKLGDELVERGLVTPAQLDDCLRLQREGPAGGRRLGTILVERRLLSQQDLDDTLIDLLGIPRVSLGGFDFDVVAMYAVPRDIVERHGVMPLMYFERQIVVATPFPLSLDFVAEVQFAAARPVRAVHAEPAQIAHAIATHYRARTYADELRAMNTIVREFDVAASDDAALWRDSQELARQAPIVRMVDAILEGALSMRASDVHIRPESGTVTMLYRLDGSLVPMREFHPALLPAVASRIKVMCRMNIAERRTPQDGRMQHAYDGQNVDIRVSTLPTRFGESLAMRILNPREVVHTLDGIGLAVRDAGAVRELVSRSHGIFLVTGPTGSGKSTTLYCALRETMARPLNIVTVEDPIEYEISGIRQIELAPQMNFSFARALRHILRHDPEVVMIGEIRDLETCQIAVQTSLTGHLVLSSLHTNDASSAIARLVDMGVEPYLIRSSLTGVLAQRLVRLNCPACLEPEDVDPFVREHFGLDPAEPFMRGGGCPACQYTGYVGRTVIYELMVVSPALGELVVKDLPVGELKRHAIAEGMVPIMDNGLALARKRRTSFDEVYRACS